MCIQTYALCLARVKNIQVGLIESGMWMQIAALDICGDATGIGAASSSNPRSSFVEQASCSIFVNEDEDGLD